MGIAQPFYLYKEPMFMVTVSAVIIVENGVIMIPVEDGSCRFPGGRVKAGQETIQFSVIRQVKEQTGIVLKKDDIIPVDFRSDPERSPSKNIVDIGMVCMPDMIEDLHLNSNAKLIPIDFDAKTFAEKHDGDFYMDHKLLLERAIDIALLMK